MSSCQDTIRSYEPFNFEDPKLPNPKREMTRKNNIQNPWEMLYVGCGPLPVTVGSKYTMDGWKWVEKYFSGQIFQFLLNLI